jgi:hypothetical protein
MRMLYIDCYTLEGTSLGQVPSSMAIGYGVTAGRVIRKAFHQYGFDLIRPLADVDPYSDGSRKARLKWVLRGYVRIAEAIEEHRPGVVFIFHSFAAFPVEIRRILLELGQIIPIIGYTHGSHWDPSDSVRHENYPGLEILDLANLLALDQILFDSDFIKSTVVDSIARLNASTARKIKEKSLVVGLPLDTDFIDACRTNEKFSRTTIVFNHAPVLSKNAVEFISVAERLMERFDINVLFTRSFRNGGPGAMQVEDLHERFGDRVILGQNLPLKEYFQVLWMSDIQVSTAHHESLGVATLEAMYTQNCCLLPCRGSYPEIAGANKHILYSSQRELEQSLALFISEPSQMRAVAKDLSIQALNYSSKAVMPRILAAIESQTSGTDRP